MRIIIKATNIELTDALRGWVEKKLRPLEKIAEPLQKTDTLPSQKEVERVDLFVEVGKTTKHHRKGDVFRAEGQLRAMGRSFRAEAVTEDLRDSISEIKNILHRQIVEHKEKIRPQD